MEQKTQRGLKQRIEYEKYRPLGKLSRADYFMEKAVLLKFLTIDQLDEEEIFYQKIFDKKYKTRLVCKGHKQ